MSTLNVEFAFDIGDMVYFRDALHNRTHWPLRFMVVERCAVEYDGAVYRSYKLSNSDKWVAAIALSKDPPPFEQTPDERIREDARVEDLRSEYRGPIDWGRRLRLAEKAKPERDPPGGEA